MKPTSGQTRATKIYKPASAAADVKARLSLQRGTQMASRIDPARLSLPANPGANRFQSGRGGRRSLNSSLNANNAAIKRVGAGGGMGNKEGRWASLEVTGSGPR